MHALLLIYESTQDWFPQSCEKIRVSLEQMEPEREMENFVRDYGTGNQIPDPPAFVNYQAPDAIPSSSARPTYRTASFNRASNRESPLRQPTALDEEPIVNTAGIGAGGNRRADSLGPEGAEVSRRNTQAALQTNHTAYTNGISGHHNQSPVVSNHSPATSQPPAQVNRRQSTVPTQTPQQQLQRVLQDPFSDSVDPTTETYIRVGENTYKVDPSKDPQQSAPPSGRLAATAASRPAVGSEADPLMKQLEELKNTVSTTGSVRRNTIIKSKTGSGPESKPTHSAASSVSNLNRQSTSALSPPGSAVSGGAGKRSPSPIRDYRNPADAVVGTHPSASRSPSPNPPTAAFMLPKSLQPTAAESVKGVATDYQQSLPGEHKSLSRNNTRSRPGSIDVSAGITHQNLIQPPNQTGRAGVGAHGSRSNSPQPMYSRAPSPQPGQLVNRNSYIQPPTQAGPGIARAPSPNTVGIALDPSGRVLHDEMAQRYQHPPQPSPTTAQPHLAMHQARVGAPQIQQSVYNPPPPPQQLTTPMQGHQRKPTYLASPGGQPYAPVTPPPSIAPMGMYHNTPSPQPNYAPQQVAPPPPVQPLYNPPPIQYQQQQQPQQQRHVPHQPPAQQHVPPVQMNHYGNANNDLQRGGSVYYWGQQAPQPVNVPPQQQQVAAPPPPTPANQMLAMQSLAQQQMYQQPPAQHQKLHRSPSPQPPPQQQPPQQSTEDGPVLFYGEPFLLCHPVLFTMGDDLRLCSVRALYDYAATIEEEFDFQAGDIIAVTSTPEDGWWTGELLDEARRQRGRNVFPSNFVTFF